MSTSAERDGLQPLQTGRPVLPLRSGSMLRDQRRTLNGEDLAHCRHWDGSFEVLVSPDGWRSISLHPCDWHFYLEFFHR